MVEYMQEIYNLFSVQHINLKREWLQEALHYVSSLGKTLEQLANMVYQQWLFSDIKISTEAIGNIQERIVSGRLRESCVFQVQSVIDVGVSTFKQRKRLTDPAYEEVVVDFDQPFNLQAKKTHSCFCLQLTDGTVEFKALEKKRVSDLSLSLSPGSKILIYENVEMRKGYVFLTESNCQVLGGTVEHLLVMADHNSVPDTITAAPQIQTTSHPVIIPADPITTTAPMISSLPAQCPPSTSGNSLFGSRPPPMPCAISEEQQRHTQSGINNLRVHSSSVGFDSGSSSTATVQQWISRAEFNRYKEEQRAEFNRYKEEQRAEINRYKEEQERKFAMLQTELADLRRFTALQTEMDELRRKFTISTQHRQ